MIFYQQSIIGLKPIEVFVRWEPARPDDDELRRNPLAKKFPNGGRSVLVRLPTAQDILYPGEFIPGSAAEFTKFLSDFEKSYSPKNPAHNVKNLGWRLFKQKYPNTDSASQYVKLHPDQFKVIYLIFY